MGPVLQGTTSSATACWPGRAKSITWLRMLLVIGSGTAISVSPTTRQIAGVSSWLQPSPACPQHSFVSTGPRARERSQVAVSVLESVSPLREVFEADRCASGHGCQGGPQPPGPGPPVVRSSVGQVRGGSNPLRQDHPGVDDVGGQFRLTLFVTPRIAIRIASSGSRNASRISSLVTTAFRGTPLIVSTPALRRCVLHPGEKRCRPRS
ncbi:MAG: hypothetical protein CM1200mP2_39980 [Planctomycetaceae bacterium]|nr:MAG: hypothetical protein CM1200mP2_39980 [Planctomycetaceae bacterium]